MEAGNITVDTKKISRGGRSTKRQRNWRGGRGGQVNSDLSHYRWTHGMCAHPGTD